MTDILIDSSYDLQIENGDFASGESTEQHQQLLLLTNKGEWRESPLVGIGIANFLKDDDAGGLLGETKKQFEMDGMRVVKVSVSGGDIKINAVYK